MIPGQLLQELEDLRARGLVLDVTEADGWVCVVLHDYVLPPCYSKASTLLLLKVPLSYPNGKPDMFWVEPEVTLANGQVPKNAEVMEPALGRQWRRFSWHAQSWNPGRDDLHTYLEFVNNRLAKAI